MREAEAKKDVGGGNIELATKRGEGHRTAAEDARTQ